MRVNNKNCDLFLRYHCRQNVSNTHSEGEWRPVALGSIVIIRGQNLYHFSRWRMFWKYRAIVLQELWGTANNIGHKSATCNISP